VGLPDPEDNGTIILRKVRNYLPIDMALTSKKTSQFQRNHLSFKKDNISGSRTNSHIPLPSVIHYDAAVRVPLLILQASPLSLCSFPDANYIRCLKIRIRSFLGTCAGMCIICLLPRVQDSNHKRIQTE